MHPNLQVDDMITVDRTIKEFTYGDIITYWLDGTPDYPTDPVPSVIRIVGMPGDSIAVKDEICIVNGKTNSTRFVREKTDDWSGDYIQIKEYEETLPNGLEVNIQVFDTSYPPGDMPSIYVPEGHYFVMGDYRNNAIDSRLFGTLPKNKIIGKVIKVEKMNKIYHILHEITK